MSNRIEAAAKAEYQDLIDSLPEGYENMPEWDDRHPGDIAYSIEKTARSVRYWLDADEDEPVYRLVAERPPVHTNCIERQWNGETLGFFVRVVAP